MSGHSDDDLDLERAVWDAQYRETVKARLRGQDRGADASSQSSAIAAVHSQEVFDTAFTIAFQPIVDIGNRRIFAYEALVRGVNGGDPTSFFRALNASDRPVFDRLCRAKAIMEALRLDIDTHLSVRKTRLCVNALPNALADEENGAAHTLDLARREGFPPERLVFEITENEELKDPDALAASLHRQGNAPVKTAIDDFGDGYAGLALLIQFQPDFIKLDKALIRDVDRNQTSQAAVGAIVRMARELGITIIAEGVETHGEMRTLRSFGIALMQGYLFARPAIDALPSVTIPETLKG